MINMDVCSCEEREQGWRVDEMLGGDGYCMMCFGCIMSGV